MPRKPIDDDPDDDDRPRPRKRRPAEEPEDDDDRPAPRKKKPVAEVPDDVDEDDDSPRPKKTKKQKKLEQIAATNRKIKIYGGIGGGVVLVLILAVGGYFIFSGKKGGGKGGTPDQFIGYDSSEEVFHVSLPYGWKVQNGGKKGTAFINAEKDGASIKVYESLVGSLLGDIAGASNPDPNGSDDTLPVSRVHEQKMRMIAEEYSGYKEDKAVTVKTGFGKARQSAFTGRSGIASKVRGYRVTALGGMTQITILCTCPEGQWDALAPAFDRVIASVGSGTGGR